MKPELNLLDEDESSIADTENYFPATYALKFVLSDDGTKVQRRNEYLRDGQHRAMRHMLDMSEREFGRLRSLLIEAQDEWIHSQIDTPGILNQSAEFNFDMAVEHLDNDVIAHLESSTRRKARFYRKSTTAKAAAGPEAPIAQPATSLEEDNYTHMKREREADPVEHAEPPKKKTKGKAKADEATSKARNKTELRRGQCLKPNEGRHW